MEFLTEYGLFLAKTLTIVVAVVMIIGFAVAAGMKNKKPLEGQVEVRRLNDHYDDIKDMMESALLDEDEYKAFIKQRKKQEKAEAKAKKAARKAAENNVGASDQASEVTSAEEKPRVFVLDFDGDIRASATDAMREEITALLAVAKAGDEAVIRLESGGGMVHSYGFAASQLKRIRDAGLTLTVCVDKVAASGGYMMACVADRILAAPFAIIGSIGVLAQMPNFHRLLKKHDIDYELITAGEYKRTLTMFGENTRKGRQKFTEEIEDVHGLFKAFVAEHRSQVDIAEVATGEVWFGQQAIANKLVDELKTSDEYITSKYATSQVFEMRYEIPKTLPQKLGVAAELAVDRLLVKTWGRATQRFYS